MLLPRLSRRSVAGGAIANLSKDRMITQDTESTEGWGVIVSVNFVFSVVNKLLIMVSNRASPATA